MQTSFLSLPLGLVLESLNASKLIGREKLLVMHFQANPMP